MGEESKLQKAEDILDTALRKIADNGRTVFIVIAVAVLFFSLGFCTKQALADGGKRNNNAGGSSDAAAFAEAHSTSNVGVGIANGGIIGNGGLNSSASQSQSTNVDTKAYSGGSTGLTSTAPCLGSTGVLFNAISTTYVEKGCVLRHYRAECKDDVCRQRLLCLDPDLFDEAKAALGCKP